MDWTNRSIGMAWNAGWAPFPEWVKFCVPMACMIAMGLITSEALGDEDAIY